MAAGVRQRLSPWMGKTDRRPAEKQIFGQLADETVEKNWINGKKHLPSKGRMLFLRIFILGHEADSGTRSG